MFEVAQEELFRLVHEHLDAEDTNFNNFVSYSTQQFNEIRQNMEFNHGATQTGITT